MADLDEQLKEVRALRDSLSWRLSDDATRVRYFSQGQPPAEPRHRTSARPPSKSKRRNGKIRTLDFPISPKESRFVVVDCQKRPLPPMMSKMARFLITAYDLLGLLHLIQVPVDHTFRPPIYQRPPAGLPTRVTVVEPM